MRFSQWLHENNISRDAENLLHSLFSGQQEAVEMLHDALQESSHPSDILILVFLGGLANVNPNRLIPVIGGRYSNH